MNRKRTGNGPLFDAPLVVGDVIYTYNHDGKVMAMKYNK